MYVRADDPLILAATSAIHTGNVEWLERLLNEAPSLTRASIDGKRTLLHIATDWPGHFPNVAVIVAALVTHGAEVNAVFGGRHCETPLHWAASSDDVVALDALLDHGANIEAPGGVIGGGTPLADAVAFGQWQAARRLVDRGANTTLWQAAALGLTARVMQYFANDPRPSPDDVTNAFWFACHGGQQSVAEYLLDRGADLNWIGHDGVSPLDAATRHHFGQVVQWLRERGARSAKELK